MGIQGLLPFLKKIHTPVNVSQFKGSTVAIDAYCWLHKGAFSCAEKLALGEKTEQYVYYCMKYVDCLLRNGLKPILVFDGCHLPSKKDVETSRRERRELNRKRAAQLLREGKRAEARECLQRCVDITPQMALELMNVCRARGVDCIVAPYEADAQLAYLNKAGIAQIIITEDSDLLLFGCQKVIFKMDFYGNGVLIEQSRLNEVVEIQDGFYTFDKFRYMCILSGCDYLSSLPGIGLAKACKVFKVARQADIRQLLKKLPSYLKMNLVVTNDYIEGFIRADNTFLYQLAFDPLTRKLCPLTPYPPEIEIEKLRYAGPYFSSQRALQIALGNIDIHTHEKIADFNPGTYVPKHGQKREMPNTQSIWKAGYQPSSKTDREEEDETCNRPCLAGKEVLVKNPLARRSPVKRAREVEDSTEVKTDLELADLYSAPKRTRTGSGDNRVTSSQTELAKDHSSEDAESLKSRQKHQSAMKQTLSPSKSYNQGNSMKEADMTASDAFSLMEQQSAVSVMPEGKENSRHGSAAKRNKFAVSALARRAKFSLDTPALPNVKVEVRSRYFGTSPKLAGIAAAQTSGSGADKSSDTDKSSNAGKDSSTVQSQSDDDPSSRRGSVLHQSQSAAKGLDCSREGDTAASPCLSDNHASFLSTFKLDSSSQSGTRISTSTSTKASSAKTSSVSKKGSNSSPGSAFSWSNFKFMKCNSSPALTSSVAARVDSNRPFKRVLSDSRRGHCSQMSDRPGDQNAEGKGDDKMEPADTPPAPATRTGTTSSPNSSQGEGDSVSDVGGSQCSSADMTTSQHSNLYSIDSDCFPGSQDLVDLTDCEADSQSVGRGPENASFTTPASATKMSVFLKSPTSAPKNTPGVNAKKCRVSGLSRGKKKSPPAADGKQQKIREMFSRFAHQKSSVFGQSPPTKLHSDGAEDQPLSSGCKTPSSTPMPCSARTNRKLLL